MRISQPCNSIDWPPSAVSHRPDDDAIVNIMGVIMGVIVLLCLPNVDRVCHRPEG